MAKISSIINSGPRVHNADLSNSLPQRRGAPLIDGMRQSDPSPRLQSSTLSAFDRLKARNLVEGSQRDTVLSQEQQALKAEADAFFVEKRLGNVETPQTENLLNTMTPAPDGRGRNISVKA